jgi:proliferating cell nuclear antigen
MEEIKLVLKNNEVFKNMISLINELVNEVTLEFNEKGLTSLSIDPANVAMNKLFFDKKNFSEYDVKENIIVTINLNKFKEIIKRAGNDDLIILKLSNESFKVQLKNKSVRTFSIPLIVDYEKSKEMPELKFDCVAMIKTQLLKEAVDDVVIVGESMTFNVNKTLFSVISSNDLSNVLIEVNSEDCVINLSGGVECVKSKFSVEYLKKMFSVKLCDSLKLFLGNEYPLKVEFSNDLFNMVFVLAPRVEND